MHGMQIRLILAGTAALATVLIIQALTDSAVASVAAVIVLAVVLFLRYEYRRNRH
jgi:Flp pilus assembly protein TadB